MNGTNYEGLCPRCDGVMECCVWHKPYDFINGICLNCGFSYHTEEKILTLEEVNIKRQLCEKKMLKELVWVLKN